MDKELKTERPEREELGLQVKQGGMYTCSSSSSASFLKHIKIITKA